MKKYITKKEIEAEPMTLGEAQDKGIHTGYLYVKEHAKNDPGYVIKDNDGGPGYWTSKKEFEEKCKPVETFVDRMKVKYGELVEMQELCEQFVCSDKFRETVKDDYQAFLLKLQNEVMKLYTAILDQCMVAAEGNSEVHTIPSMSFGVATEALKFGFAIRRAGWNGKGLMVFKQVPAHITGAIIPKMTSLPEDAKKLILATKGFINYESQCLIFNSNTGRADSWVPSISDVFAEDWEIVTVKEYTDERQG